MAEYDENNSFGMFVGLATSPGGKPAVGIAFNAGDKTQILYMSYEQTFYLANAIKNAAEHLYQSTMKAEAKDKAND